MKVVINKVYGGFGLSAEGLAYYYQLKGEGAVYYYEAVKGQKRQLYKRVTPHLLARPFLKDFGKGPVHISQADQEQYAIDSHKISRTDPHLIQVVEELGEAANSEFSRLVIIEIPDDVKWELKEIDGDEWIAEVHRTWGQ